MKFKALFLALFLSISSYGSPETFLATNNISLDTRSKKGWIRVMSSESKRNQYNMNTLTNRELAELKVYIERYFNEKHDVYKGGLR